MKIANKFKQNSPEWYTWRQGGLGASDAPIIMGVSPFQSRFELWLAKTGKGSKPDFHPNAIKAMVRGTLLEPVARTCYEKKVGVSFESDVNVIHPQYDFIRASLDGYNAAHNRIVEIKCPGKVDLEEARKGRVPKKYLPQVQLQLALTGAVACDYFTFDGEDGSAVEVLPDIEYQAKLIAEMVIFWDMVQQESPPMLASKDLLKLSRAYDDAREKVEKLKETYEFAESCYNKQKGDK